MRGELVADRRAEVRGVLAHALGRERHDVFGLVAEIGRSGDAPVAEAGAIVLAMELAVERIARVALRRGPDLAGDLRVPRDRGDGGISHEVRPEEIDRGIDERIRDVEHRGPRAAARMAVRTLRPERLRRATDLP